jgi:uncharacterized protein YkwD
MKTLLKFAFSVLAILVTLALVGVEPLASYKDAIVDNWSSIIDTKTDTPTRALTDASVPVTEDVRPDPYTPVPTTTPSTLERGAIAPDISPILIQRTDDDLKAVVQLDFSKSSAYGVYHITLVSKVERLGAVTVSEELGTQDVLWSAQETSTKTIYYTLIPGTQAYRFAKDGSSPSGILSVAVTFNSQQILTSTDELTQLEADIVESINRRRQDSGLPVLVHNARLSTELDIVTSKMIEEHALPHCENGTGAVIALFTNQKHPLTIINNIAQDVNGNALLDAMDEVAVSISTIDSKELSIVLLLLPKLDSTEFQVHFLINKTREQAGRRWVRWNADMYVYAKSQSTISAQAGKLIHSYRDALDGGENLWMTPSHVYAPVAIVDFWLNSPAHRGWLLSSEVSKAAIGITESEYGTFVAWSFSD